jgi:hypothetical protein
MKRIFLISICILVLALITSNSYSQMSSGMVGGQKGEMGRGQMMEQKDMMGSMKCAEQWLKKAIDLHEIHLKDPKTATEASQMEMMDQMKKAYDCLTGPYCKMGETPSKESESKEPKKEEPSMPRGY